MELNELIRRLLLQMYQSSLPGREELERLDSLVLDQIREEVFENEKIGACRIGEGGAGREQSGC
ncbi:MAG: hypothetical protein IJ746_02835 [Ruminococcus sp.]|nr:hypothetical protein [Ruminococcus sp.]